MGSTARPVDDGLGGPRERLEAIVEMQRSVAISGLDPDHVMREIARGAMVLTDADGAAVAAVDADARELVYRAAAGSVSRQVGVRIGLDSSLAGRSVTERSPQMSEDVETDERVDREACRRAGVRSLIVVPLIRADVVEGALTVTSEEAHAFAAADLQSLEVVGGLAAAVLGDARAYVREQGLVAELKDLDELKSAFVAAASHDMRGRIAAIQGYAELLESVGPELSEEDRRQFAREIVASARRLRRMLANLLDLERLEEGRLTLKREPTDLSDLVRRVVSDVEMVKGRDIVVDVPDEVTIAVDEELIERVVENLAMNATKYTRADARIAVSLQVDGDDVLLTVDDDGPGIPEEERDAVFERYSRGSSASPDAPGSGIGLHLVRRFAELHGGRAWAGESDGGGARFRVRLPRSSP